MGQIESPHPLRIQRCRTKGWRKPPGAICVTRPGRWGNPFEKDLPAGMDQATIVALFRKHVIETGMDVSELRGTQLACWCSLAEPCHADVLAELANVGGTEILGSDSTDNHETL